MQAAVDQDVEVAELDEQRVGADAAVAVQVDKLHSVAQIRVGRPELPSTRLGRTARGPQSTGASSRSKGGEEDVDLGARARRRRGSCPGPRASHAGDVVAVVGKLLAGGEARASRRRSCRPRSPGGCRRRAR